MHGSESPMFHEQRISSVAKVGVSLYHGDCVQDRCSYFNDTYSIWSVYSDLTARCIPCTVVTVHVESVWFLYVVCAADEGSQARGLPVRFVKPSY